MNRSTDRSGRAMPWLAGTRRAALLATAVTVTAMAVSGCTGTADEPAQPVSTTAATDAADTASGSWNFSPPPADSVLGSGTIESPDGAVTGTIAIVTNSERFAELVVSGFSTTDSRLLQTTLVSTPDSVFDCFNPEGYAYSLPQLSSQPEQRFAMGPVDDLPSGDPGFLDSALVYAAPEPPGPEGFGGCYGDVIGIADLTWNFPQTVTPAVDAGATAGATGVATVGEVGTPLAYEVATGDALTTIAERFGVAPTQILYLNAGRISPQGIIDDEAVYAGETLKLDAGLR
jgi:LysM repeat protein